MKRSWMVLVVSSLAGWGVVGCGDDDGGDPAIDAGADSGAEMMGDSGAPPDSATPADGGEQSDGAAMCMPGVECADWMAAIDAAPRGADGIDNCAIHLHQADCCGARRAYGINHGARTTLCPAEDDCVAMYPAEPGCTDDAITTDTGETTTTLDEVKLRWVDGTCETFVCTTPACQSDPGVVGGCGP